MRTILSITAAVFVFANAAHADIFQWEYIDPADPSQGKQQSTTLAPDGAGVDAMPGENLSYRSLTMAYLIGADLTGADGYYANLTNADLSRANLTNAHFGGANLTAATFREANLTNVNLAEYSNSCDTDVCYPFHATLTDADFTDADVRGANLGFTGITLAQLYSTTSYQAKDLGGIDLSHNDFAGGTFAGQNLTNASFAGATLTGADLADANVRGASFATGPAYGGGTGITLFQLYSTASYRAQDLSGIDLGHGVDFGGGGNFARGNFAGQKLTNVSFNGDTLTDADFTDADVRGVNFSKIYGCLLFSCTLFGTGITPAQLYTTASYQAHDLSGIDFAYNGLAGGNFAGQYLTNANFGGARLSGANFRGANLANASFIGIVSADLTGADLSAADARGASALNLSAATSTNLIRPDGHISGLDLGAGGLLGVRDYEGPSYNPALVIPIMVDQHLAMGAGGTLRMVFEADDWDSTISLAPGIPVTLGGTLELTFADDVNLASQIGRTIDLFDWTGVNPTGAFAISSPYPWNLSNLYTTGEVTLTAIPEPASIALVAAAAFFGRRLRRRFRTAPQLDKIGNPRSASETPLPFIFTA